MRLPLLASLLLPGWLMAAEPAYPLWDNHESVAIYAARANLPPTKTLELGNDVTLELVLIPAGKFIMGPQHRPEPVDQEGFRNRILLSKALLAFGGGVLLVLLGAIFIQAIHKRQRPKFSLARLLAVSSMTGVAILSGLYWRESARKFEAATTAYNIAWVEFTKDADERPHPVTLTTPFYMGKFTVTQEQYLQIVGSNPSMYATSKDNPVEQVSWNDAHEFCKKVSARSGRTVRLPTEAEWEFACRAGTTTKYLSGDTLEGFDRIAWYWDNSHNTPHPVGQKEPNGFGCYDMLGNVLQWCQDWYAPEHATVIAPEVDPQGPVDRVDLGYSLSHKPPYEPAYGGRILRGSAWHYGPGRVTEREQQDPDSHNIYVSVGFRVVMSAAAAP